VAKRGLIVFNLRLGSTYTYGTAGVSLMLMNVGLSQSKSPLVSAGIESIKGNILFSILGR
jgi:hypothetical protein